MGGYTGRPKVGQKPAVPASRVEGQMPRAVIFIIVILLVIAGALVFLSGQAREVPTQQVEIDVTNAAAH